MKITNLRQDAVNSMTLEINGQKYRIVGDAEISLREAKKSIPGCLENVETIAEIRENLGFYDRRLIAAKERAAALIGIALQKVAEKLCPSQL